MEKFETISHPPFLRSERFELCALKWPTVYDTIKQETATIVFKSICGLAPTYLSTLFARSSTRETVNLRNSETDLFALQVMAKKHFRSVDQRVGMN